MRLSRVSVGEPRDPTIHDGDGWARYRCDRNVKCDKEAPEKLRGVVPRLRAGPMDDVKLGEPISNKCSWKKPPSRWAPDESTTNVVLLSELRRCTSARARDQARSSTKNDQSATRLGRESHRCVIDTSRVLHESETEIREMKQVGIVLGVG